MSNNFTRRSWAIALVGLIGSLLFRKTARSEPSAIAGGFASSKVAREFSGTTILELEEGEDFRQLSLERPYV